MGPFEGKGPLLSAQRYCDAVLSALDSRAAAAGQFYFGAKWLPEKLRALGDVEGLETFEAALRTPKTEREALAYASLCEAALQELVGPLERGRDGRRLRPLGGR